MTERADRCGRIQLRSGEEVRVEAIYSPWYFPTIGEAVRHIRVVAEVVEQVRAPHDQAATS